MLVCRLYRTASRINPRQPLPKGHPAVVAPKEVVPLSGKVLQTMDSGGYTYIYLQKKEGEKVWVAIPRAKVVVGKKIDLVPGYEFKNFESKTLNRTFDKIIFSLGPVAPKGVKEGTQVMKTPGSKAAAVPPEKMKVERQPALKLIPLPNFLPFEKAWTAKKSWSVAKW